MPVLNTIVRSHVRAIRDHILVQDMNFKERTTKRGLILQIDDGKNHGIRPRWAKVYAIGPEQKHIKVGQWVLVEHGRWTRGVHILIDDVETTVRRIDNKDILGVFDGAGEPEDEILGHLT